MRTLFLVISLCTFSFYAFAEEAKSARAIIEQRLKNRIALEKALLESQSQRAEAQTRAELFRAEALQKVVALRASEEASLNQKIRDRVEFYNQNPDQLQLPSEGIQDFIEEQARKDVQTNAGALHVERIQFLNSAESKLSAEEPIPGQVPSNLGNPNTEKALLDYQLSFSSERLRDSQEKSAAGALNAFEANPRGDFNAYVKALNLELPAEMEANLRPSAQRDFLRIRELDLELESGSKNDEQRREILSEYKDIEERLEKDPQFGIKTKDGKTWMETLRRYEDAVLELQSAEAEVKTKTETQQKVVADAERKLTLAEATQKTELAKLQQEEARAKIAAGNEAVKKATEARAAARARTETRMQDPAGNEAPIVSTPAPLTSEERSQIRRTAEANFSSSETGRGFQARREALRANVANATQTVSSAKAALKNLQDQQNRQIAELKSKIAETKGELFMRSVAVSPSTQQQVKDGAAKLVDKIQQSDAFCAARDSVKDVLNWFQEVEAKSDEPAEAADLFGDGFAFQNEFMSKPEATYEIPNAAGKTTAFSVVRVQTRKGLLPGKNAAFDDARWIVVMKKPNQPDYRIPSTEDLGAFYAHLEADTSSNAARFKDAMTKHRFWRSGVAKRNRSGEVDLSSVFNYKNYEDVLAARASDQFTQAQFRAAQKERSRKR